MPVFFRKELRLGSGFRIACDQEVGCDAVGIQDEEKGQPESEFFAIGLPDEENGKSGNRMICDWVGG